MSGLTQHELATLLEETSRTFALAIPLLEEPLATQVGAAYLVFRIADTLEDAPLWARDTRIAALRSFDAWMDGAPLHVPSPPSNDACVTLLARADDVRATVASFPAAAREAIASHAKRTARGMADFVERQDERGGIELRDVADLQDYCYVVAGIVGEMLTELFAIVAPSLDRASLGARAAAFGEGLQLVNILKDGTSDAKEGRVYVPPSVPRTDVMALARADLARAEEYIALLAPAPESIRAFCTLPVRLATATLDALASGAAKLTREDVMRIFASSR
ncbi:MAG TPA: squalene/phytoene synthase family protein [Labilithrix sp.]